jgi:ADP-L-glycero-D-manno-heptose 6-epimerase
MIIVTGGAGFIGSCLVAGLQGHKNLMDITVCDYLGEGDKWRNLSKRELGDIVHPDRLFDYMHKHADKIEAVFHMGAISSTTESDVDLIMDNNFILTRRLWKFCAANNIRLIYASAAVTYGDGAQGFKDDASVEALSKLRPLNPYGWSKHLFDRRIARVSEADGLTATEETPPQWVGLKFFSVYGPNEYHKDEQKSVISKLFPQVDAGATAKLFKSHNPDYEDGEQMRDFIYVKDCVDVMLWLYDHPEVNGLYNLGSGKARSFNDLALAVFKAADKPPRIQYVDMPVSLRGKYQYFTEADMDKLRKAGYTKDFTSLEDGVKDYVSNYMATSDPYM